MVGEREEAEEEGGVLETCAERVVDRAKEDSVSAPFENSHGLPRRHEWKRTSLPMQEAKEMWVSSLGREDPLQPTPVLLPGESQGQRSLVGYGPWGPKELDMIEATWHAKISTAPTENMIFKAEEQDAFPLK